MYFQDKFNEEIQKIIRNMYPLTYSTSIGSFNRNTFQMVEVIQKLPDGTYHTNSIVKIYPLIMCDTLTVSNKNDYICDNKVAVCHKQAGTVITAKKEDKE